MVEQNQPVHLHFDTLETKKPVIVCLCTRFRCLARLPSFPTEHHGSIPAAHGLISEAPSQLLKDHEALVPCAAFPSEADLRGGTALGRHGAGAGAMPQEAASPASGHLLRSLAGGSIMIDLYLSWSDYVLNDRLKALMEKLLGFSRQGL